MFALQCYLLSAPQKKEGSSAWKRSTTISLISSRSIASNYQIFVQFYLILKSIFYWICLFNCTNLTYLSSQLPYMAQLLLVYNPKLRKQKLDFELLRSHGLTFYNETSFRGQHRQVLCFGLVAWCGESNKVEGDMCVLETWKHLDEWKTLKGRCISG